MAETSGNGNNLFSIWGYIGNLASVAGLIAFGMDYVPRILKVSTSTLDFKPFGILLLLIFISAFSFYLPGSIFFFVFCISG